MSAAHVFHRYCVLFHYCFFFSFLFFFLFDNERTYIYIIALRLRETSSLSRLLFRVLPSLCVYRAFFDNQTNERSIRNRRQQKKRRRNEKTEPLASMNAPVKDALQLLLLLLFCLLLLTQTLIPAGFFSFFLFFFFLLLSSALSGDFERKHRNMSLGEIPTSA